MPVIKEALSDDKNKTLSDTSFSVPKRCIGTVESIRFFT
jgi:hypothetical protein